MHPLLKADLNLFKERFELSEMGEPELFERFANTTLIAKASGAVVDPETVTTQPGEVGIDGAAISLDGSLLASAQDAEATFRAAQRPSEVAYYFVQAKSSRKLERDSILNFGASVQDLLGDGSLPTDDLLAEIRETHEIVLKYAGAKVKDGRPSCTLFYVVASDAKPDAIAQSTAKKVETDIKDLRIFESVAFQFVNEDSLHEGWTQLNSPVHAEFDVLEDLSLPKMQGVRQAYFVLVRASEFVLSVLCDSDGRVRPGIFEQNIRHYLGGDNSVNDKIKETLRDDESRPRFCILNNGITIVAKRLTRVAKRFSMDQFQIVNGCQTSHVLLESVKTLEEGDTHVLIRLIEIEEARVVDQVVEATNSQTAIPDSQFLAMKANARRVQGFFENYSAEKDFKLYFERRTREYVTRDLQESRVFDVRKLTKTYVAMFLERPFLSTGYTTRIFEEVEDDIFKSDVPDIAYYVAALSYFKLKQHINGKRVSAEAGRLSWYVLMALKYVIAGRPPALAAKRRMEAYCKKIVLRLTTSATGALEDFERALELVGEIAGKDRPRLKTKAASEAFKAALHREFSAGPGGAE